jgi:hypothetical protein
MPTRHRALAALLLVVAAAGCAPAEASPLTANGTQPVLAHPILPSGNCTVCHGDYDGTRSYEPGPAWQGSMMAQSGRDPLFWAALDVANADAPGVGDFCLRCHAPRAWYAGRSEPQTDGCGLLGKIDEPFADNDFDGINCHFCHRVQENPVPPAGQASRYFDNGQVWLDDGDCGGLGEPCRHGPYDYAVAGMPAPHPWRYSPYLTSSDMCATCHNVTNPVKNLIVGGVDASIPFPIERTHREWSLSAYAVPMGPDSLTCQQCHMPDEVLSPAWGSSFQWNDHAGDLGRHEFVGGNAWIPDVLRREYPALGIGNQLDGSRLLALELLQQRSAEISVATDGPLPPGEALSATVTVTNLTGHKLPTGYPEGRRMWLHVTARDAAGTLLWESGAYDPATGVLTRDSQVKVYEAKQGVWSPTTSSCETEDAGGELFHFVLNDCVALDNRIPPRGFTGAGDIQTAPVGYTYPETAPGSGVLAHWDGTTYAIPVPPTALTPITVTATLRYQTASKEYVEFLRDEAVERGFPDDCIERTTGLPDETRGALLYDMWASYGRSAPVDMAEASASATIASVDPMLCYRSKPTKGAASFLPASGLTLDDRFGAMTAKAPKAKAWCEPATVGTTAPGDADTRLLTLTMKPVGGGPSAPSGLAVSDALGTLTLDAKKPERLLVPSALGAQPPDPSSTVDAFSCWKARIAKGTPKLPKGLQLTAAGAMTTPAKTYDVKAVRRVCVATALNGTPRKNPGAALVCYRAKQTKGAPKHVKTKGTVVTSSLGGMTLDTTADDTICLPASIAP